LRLAQTQKLFLVLGNNREAPSLDIVEWLTA
jgi:hypothetical protein